MEKLYTQVFEYPLLQEYLEQSGVNPKDVYKIVNEIHGSFNDTMVGYGVKILEHSFAKLYDSVNLSTFPGLDLYQLRKKYHIVLVPNHQSHADYIALNYLLFRQFKVPVHIASGINLNIFPIGTFFRNMGAFFIRRSFAQDLLYRRTFEGYLYYLLKEHKVLEFFFEGGRSRTGKLLPPRFGLFQMILEVHSHLPSAKPLMFVPVSIAHEHVPEERSHERELSGAKKKKEKTTQLLKLFKLFTKKLGSIHIYLGEGIIINGKEQDVKAQTQMIAFNCFRSVGSAMPVTPTSLLALVLLDEAAGALTWEQIEYKCKEVISFAKRFQIPLTPSLASNEKRSATLKNALNLLIRNKKVERMEREKLNHTFYTVRDDGRIKLSYFKNMILHHFLVPCLINNTWFNAFTGNITTVKQLVQYLIIKRRELKFEFYLPPVKEMFAQAMEIISYAVGRPISNFEECFKLSSTEFYQIAQRVQFFSTALTSIYECYYCSLLSLRHFLQEGVSFSIEDFIQVSQEIHQIELEHGRVVRYPESKTVPTLKESLKYFCHIGILQLTEDKKYHVINEQKLTDKIEKFAKDINDQLVINLKFSATHKF